MILCRSVRIDAISSKLAGFRRHPSKPASFARRRGSGAAYPETRTGKCFYRLAACVAASTRLQLAFRGP